jgi:hypothetical protein
MKNIASTFCTPDRLECISHRIQKHKFDVTCPNVLFMEAAQVPSEHEKLYVNILRLSDTGMHYVTDRYHLIQKHKFKVGCHDVFWWNPYRSHRSKKNSVLMFHSPDPLHALPDLQIPLDTNTQVQRNVSQHTFSEI